MRLPNILLSLCFVHFTEAWIPSTVSRAFGETSTRSRRTREATLLLLSPSSSFPTTTSSFPTTTDEDKITVSPQTDDVVTVLARLQPQGDYVPEPLIDAVVWHDALMRCVEIPDVDACNPGHDGEVELQFVLNRGNYLPGLHD